MGHPAAGVAALPGEVEPVRRLPVELDAQRLSQRIRSGASRTVTSTASRWQSPAPATSVSSTWSGKVVVGAEHRGHAPLGVLGVPLLAVALREDEHAAVPGRLEGEGEAGHPAAQDQEIDVFARGWRHGRDP